MVMVFNISCATILDGSKKSYERTSDIQWGYFIADLLLTGPLGLIIDFASGAIYKSSKPGANLEQDIRRHLVVDRMPVYRVTDDKVLSVTMSPDGTLAYTEIARETLPAPVLASLDKLTR